MSVNRSRVPPSVLTVADNDDLLFTILLFVPAKPLIFMKLVNKRWQSLISAEPFRRLHAVHRRTSEPPQSYIIRANSTRFFYFNPTRKILRPYHDFRFIYHKILQSCHGLLLLEVKYSRYGRKNYCVFNPTTAESRNILIDGGAKDKKEPIRGLCLALDPEKSIYYKVICIRRDKNHPNLHWIETYDSQTRSWNRLEKPFKAADEANFFHGIFWKDGIYWIKRTHRDSYYLNLETGITGTTQRVLTHKKNSDGSQNKYVIESNGHMHFVSMYSNSKRIMMKVSELMDGLVWIEKYNVDLKPVCSEFPEMVGWQATVLCIVRGDNEEESAVYFLVPGKIIYYRFCDGYFEDLFHLETKEFYDDGRLQHHRNHAYQFTESFVPV